MITISEEAEAKAETEVVAAAGPTDAEILKASNKLLQEAMDKGRTLAAAVVQLNAQHEALLGEYALLANSKRGAAPSDIHQNKSPYGKH